MKHLDRTLVQGLTDVFNNKFDSVNAQSISCTAVALQNPDEKSILYLNLHFPKKRETLNTKPNYILVIEDGLYYGGTGLKPYLPFLQGLCDREKLDLTFDKDMQLLRIVIRSYYTECLAWPWKHPDTVDDTDTIHALVGDVKEMLAPSDDSYTAFDQLSSAYRQSPTSFYNFQPFSSAAWTTATAPIETTTTTSTLSVSLNAADEDDDDEDMEASLW